MSRSPLDIDDLVEHWTLLPDELDLVVRLHEPSRLVFAVWLKFYTRHGRFPRGRGELHGDAVRFVARQLRVSAGDLGLVEWSGRTADVPGAAPPAARSRSSTHCWCRTFWPSRRGRRR